MNVEPRPSRRVAVAACSTPPPARDLSPEDAYDHNVCWAERLVEEAAARGAEIACLPEMCSSTGAARSLPLEEIPTGETARRFAALARHHRLHLIAPMLGLLDGTPRNAALVFDASGEYRGAYLKVHLTTPEREQGLMPGDDWPVFELPLREGGSVMVGVFICFDVNFPEAARALAVEGAELLFHPTVYSMYGEVGWEAVLRARAIDNCVPICTVNHGTLDDEPWMPGMSLGRSGVIGADGLTLAENGRYAGVAVATLELDRPRLVRAFGVSGVADFRKEMWRHRRPETYGGIVRTSPPPSRPGRTPSPPAPAVRSGHAAPLPRGKGSSEPAGTGRYGRDLPLCHRERSEGS